MKRVISASRRIDMVGGFPDQLAALLAEKCLPQETHTVVLWTKNPTNLLEHENLRRACSRYPLYLHFTITGMGGSFLEPNVPPARAMLNLLGPVTAFVGGPERVRIRFDPILHLRSSDDDIYCNLPQFEEIAAEAARFNIRNFSVSWMSAYKKVVSRLRINRIEEMAFSSEQRNEELQYLLNISSRYNIILHCCSMPELPVSRCIDGELLTQLHPEHSPCSTRKAKGQRGACGCTESLDIGWYYQCPHSCLYCYANPAPLLEHTHDIKPINN